MRNAIYCGLVSFVLHSLFIQPAYARVQGEGLVSIDGQILESPCSIDTGSRDQTIEMGNAPVGTIARDGHGPGKLFSIVLRNCRIKQEAEKHYSELQGVRVVFDGENERGLYSINGGAEGVGLQLFDSDGNIAIPGIPVSTTPIVGDVIKLNYTLRLTGNSKPTKAGDYYAVSLKFKMEYD